MRAEQSVSPPRCNQLAGSIDFCSPSGRSYLAEDARRGNHDLTPPGTWRMSVQDTICCSRNLITKAIGFGNRHGGYA